MIAKHWHIAPQASCTLHMLVFLISYDQGHTLGIDVHLGVLRLPDNVIHSFSRNSDLSLVLPLCHYVRMKEMSLTCP